MSTNRIKLTVCYDGTEFCGWAAQSGLRTVQSTLKDAVRQISGEENEITGASRTDSGAHAIGQVCHFDTENPMPAERWERALNAILPQDLSVVSSVQVAIGFHSRFWAHRRFYRYRIRCGPRMATESRYVHDIWKFPDLDLMRKACALLEGQHDYWAFSEETPADRNCIRLLDRVQIRPVRNQVWFEVVGTAFMRGMMRRMAGGVLEVGLGKRPAEDIAKLLDPVNRKDLQRPPVLPAKGLTLMKVLYGRHPKDLRLKNECGQEPNDQNEETEYE